MLDIKDIPPTPHPTPKSVFSSLTQSRLSFPYFRAQGEPTVLQSREPKPPSFEG